MRLDSRMQLKDRESGRQGGAGACGRGATPICHEFTAEVWRMVLLVCASGFWAGFKQAVSIAEGAEILGWAAWS